MISLYVKYKVSSLAYYTIYALLVVINAGLCNIWAKVTKNDEIMRDHLVLFFGTFIPFVCEISFIVLIRNIFKDLIKE